MMQSSDRKGDMKINYIFQVDSTTSTTVYYAVLVQFQTLYSPPLLVIKYCIPIAINVNGAKGCWTYTL